MIREPNAHFPARAAARLAAIALLAVALGGCGGVRETIGFEAEPPDEFQVMVRAPLSMPPDFGLPAPAPGTAGPQQATRDRTRQIVLDAEGRAQAKRVRPEDIRGVTRAEAVLLARIGADDAAPDIRATVDRETAQLESQSQTFVESLLFWKQYEPPVQVVDPVAERRRLQENAALGRPADAGATPQIERKRSRSLLETLF